MAYLSRGSWRQTSSVPGKAKQVPSDFFGLCVANAPESASDNYVIARLNELGIRHARLDFTYGDRDAFTERFLDRLLTDRFRVCLHLVQPREEAYAMLRHPEAADRWRAFVGDMLDRYGSRVELIEIGATCNRRKWSGYSPSAFFNAWQIAWEEARGRNITIAGPNVTDFEPVYNAGWLGEMRRCGLLPGVHTDNLFVERATEPEAFDHKVAGQRLASLLRFNLVRKAQLLQDIGAWAGVPALMCAHVTWSLRRIARILEDVEEKQADYLARYACLAAASGALERVYWGPLIGQREGLIDDGTSEYPEIPHVTYYEQARGEIKNYRLRPAFRTFQTVNRLLAGATFQRRLPTGPGLEILEFACAEDGGEKEKQTPNAQRPMPNAQYRMPDDGVLQPARPPASLDEVLRASNAEHPPATPAPSDCGRGSAAGGSKIENLPAVLPAQQMQAGRKLKILHAVWTTDGNGAGAESCYPPELLARAEIYARDGQRLEQAPRMFSESPVFLVWQNQATDDRRRTTDIERRPIPGIRFARQPGWDFDIVRPEDNAMGLAGVHLVEDGGKRVDIRALMALLGQSNTEKQTPNAQRPTSNAECRMKDNSHLQSEISNQQFTTLRAARNTVWSVSAPWNAGQTIVIKAFKSRGAFRRLLDHGKPNKALRSWNGAQELLRRGLCSPTPLACLATEKTAPHNTKCCNTGYYICEAFAPAWSARDAFNAFSAGAATFQGYSANNWYEAIAVFLQKMHSRGVYFRDLSAGNLLVRATPSGELEFALIDTARARFYSHSLGLRTRLCDLIRLCHPLFWAGRNVFVEKYLAHSGRRFSWWMKIPFWYYDGKHRVKNALKRK
ncbi:MAG: lipopolysaccharide kinase InaA family protein [Kiritimatiellae bacterium]|nr:lipopolysaccharide kinase InaA family protein [Kiritimatiellia bacterium]